MKPGCLLICLFFAIVAGGVTYMRAQNANTALRAKFDAYDKNHDGVLTASEVPPRLFTALDLDNDGKVNPVEALKAVRKMGEPPAEAPSVDPGPSGPAILKATELGVGRQVSDLPVKLISGQETKLSGLIGQGKGVVLAYTSATCPVSKRYLPSLGRLAAELKAQGIALALVNPMTSETDEQIKAQLSTLGAATVAYIKDAGQVLSRELNARTTTEVLFVDARRTLIYRGALDDQYGINYNLDAPRQTYLKDAVVDYLAGRAPRVAATQAPGCELDLGEPSAPSAVASVTYYQHVARILQQNCLECHHTGGTAPFSLEEPAAVVDRAKTIQRVISKGEMPPWFAEDDSKSSHQLSFSNDRSLTAEDKTNLLAWLESAAKPMGDAKDAPIARSYSKEGWQHGTPELVVAFPKAQKVKAEGKMPYVNLTVDTGVTKDTWLQGYQVLPGAQEVVHHVLVFVIDPANGGEARFREQDGFFAAYVPGAGSEYFPKGFAKKLPAGAKLRFQMHYTPNGTATEDLTRIGFYLAKEPPRNEVHVASVVNARFAIPPGDANHLVEAQRKVPADIHLMTFMPHMHVRGKSFRYELETAKGSQTLLNVPRYDFNWQLQYHLSEPLLLPRGTVLRGIAHFDNSTGNPANPDPTRTVKWGQQTDDEMMIGYISYYVPVLTGAE
jgi:hypothetical protein